MDTEGYARGSHWYPGALPGLQEAAEPHSSDPQQSADSPIQQDSEVITAFHAAVAAARLQQAGDGQAQLANEGSAEHDQAAGPAAAQAASTPRAAMQGGISGTDGPKASTPVPRRKRPGKLWQVSVGQDGLMEGCKGPRQVGRASHVSGCCRNQCLISSVLWQLWCRRQCSTCISGCKEGLAAVLSLRHLMLQVSPHIAALLQCVMEDRHVLTEPEMVQLFATRGSDFHVSVACSQLCGLGCTIMLQCHNFTCHQLRRDAAQSL